jgi:uncharacterized protein YecT (DUF1311 family)
MQYLFTLLFIIFYVSGFSQTQAEMNAETQSALAKADKELNTVYKAILAEYKADTAFIHSLKAAQRLWIAFRDAELKLKYPASDTFEYGSVYPMCAALYLEQLTRQRSATLNVWLVGMEEGEACRGSVKFKEERDASDPK